MADILRVIFYSEDGQWLAQGLEHDICAQAETIDDLYSRFEVAVSLECAETGALDHIEPAPAHFEKMWSRQSGEFKPANATAQKYSIGLAA